MFFNGHSVLIVSDNEVHFLLPLPDALQKMQFYTDVILLIVAFHCFHQEQAILLGTETLET